ncbi:MAG: type I DNA topoisomerase [Oligoflexia bacterium]|nr:type I DNA topoisomerase [Oligoflexia bacterium]
MKKSLVIVESPAKAKTIEKYLGKEFQVLASVGHIRDLPTKKLGVDVKKKFKPTYEIIKGKDKVIDAIKAAAKKAEKIFLAPDPDREGEAIAWHIAEELDDQRKKIKRVMFNEITKKAVVEALKHPHEINQEKFESQQARRILDRLVGYQISPVLWDKVRRGLSAGRVQSVALRLVVDREKEIEAFKPEEYWSIHAHLFKGKDGFWAKLSKIGKEKAEIANEAQAKSILKDLENAKYSISKVERSERRRNPLAPFITSRLQQEASRKLRYPAKKTMMIAQKLYEGIELGDLGASGLITYMRTDSTRISDDALKDTRKFIESQYGKKYLPADPVIYKTKKSAQDAHEAIRPTNLEWTPKVVKEYLTPEQYKLYVLIWNRFIACQMVPAVYDQTSVDVNAGNYTLRASGSILKFDGFTAVYEESAEEDAVPSDDDDKQNLPEGLEQGQNLTKKELKPEQHFTQPPPRYSDASLIKDLEEKGIGRPSTYASIITTIVDKKYVDKDPGGRFTPTDLGKIVTELLIENFKEIMDVEFTASMEDQLDRIEDGDRGWVETLTAFYGPFKKTLDVAKEKMRNIKAQAIPTDIVCPKDNAMMVIKWGRNGQFLACSNYPDCKSTAEFDKSADGKITVRPVETTDEKCEKCGSPMVVKNGRFGKFLACSAYPECKTTKAISLGVKCPKNCGGEVTSRVSRRGRPFYGCSSYPKCDFVSWDKPLNRVCPSCKSPYLVDKFSKKKGNFVKCPNKECDYIEEGTGPANQEAPAAG